MMDKACSSLQLQPGLSQHQIFNTRFVMAKWIYDNYVMAISIEIRKRKVQKRSTRLNVFAGLFGRCYHTQYCDPPSNNVILHTEMSGLFSDCNQQSFFIVDWSTDYFLDQSTSCSVRRVFESARKRPSVMPTARNGILKCFVSSKTRRYLVCCQRAKESQVLCQKKKTKLHGTMLENHRTQIQRVKVFLNQVTKKTSRGLCVSPNENTE